jgi:hypothetical protein
LACHQTAHNSDGTVTTVLKPSQKVRTK